MVDDFNAVCKRIVLDVQGFTRLLAAKVGGRRIEVIVIGLPYHRGPAGMAHPKEQSCSTAARRFEHATIAVVVDELRPAGELLDVTGFAKTFAYELIEDGRTLCTLQSEVMLPPFGILWP